MLFQFYCNAFYKPIIDAPCYATATGQIIRLLYRPVDRIFGGPSFPSLPFLSITYLPLPLSSPLSLSFLSPLSLPSPPLRCMDP